MMNEAEMHLDLLAQAGTMLLENGAPTYRVTETLNVLAQSLALSHLEIFATATGLLGGFCIGFGFAQKLKDVFETSTASFHSES